MFRIVLLEPEIPQNTGNIARLCASTGIELILVGRLGFSIDDKYLKRAAMDYWEHVNVTYIKTLDEYFEANNNFYAISTKGHKNYTEITININSKIDILFGSEGAGLPNFVYEKYTDRLYLESPLMLFQPEAVMAPSRMERLGSGIIRAGSTFS